MRRKYLRMLHDHTGRSTVLYAANFMRPGATAVSVDLGDMQGFMEAFKGLPGPGLDLILHSPGGSAEAADRLVRYMRSKFDHVRVFVPLAAMSAATMWAMGADEIVMGRHSQLGPIDPQVTFNGVTMPAGALLDQFRDAQDECATDPSRITGWLPTLQQYPPGLLNFCQSATDLATLLVGEWLADHMMKDAPDPKVAAESTAAWLADDKTHLSHSRAITRDQLREHGVKVTDLEDDPVLQDLVLSVHHATMHTFQGSVAKLVENHLGAAWVSHEQSISFPVQGLSQPMPFA